ncbi:hypothetical protein QP185_21430 [Sphingomonas aerolata]
MTQLDEGWRGAATILGRALRDPLLVDETQRADPADVVDPQQIIEAIQGAGVDLLAAAAGVLPSLGMVSLNDALTPSVWLGVGDGGMEDRTSAYLAVKLRAGNERQRGLEGEAVGVGQPAGIIFEARALAASC